MDFKVEDLTLYKPQEEEKRNLKKKGSKKRNLKKKINKKIIKIKEQIKKDIIKEVGLKHPVMLVVNLVIKQIQ